jgi:hypothetical protein
MDKEAGEYLKRKSFLNQGSLFFFCLFLSQHYPADQGNIVSKYGYFSYGYNYCRATFSGSLLQLTVSIPFEKEIPGGITYYTAGYVRDQP